MADRIPSSPQTVAFGGLGKGASEFSFFLFFTQVEDEVDEVTKTEFEKLEERLGEKDAPLETDSSAPAKSI